MFALLLEPKIKAFIQRTAEKNSVSPNSVTVTYDIANGLQSRISKMGTVIVEKINTSEL